MGNRLLGRSGRGSSTPVVLVGEQSGRRDKRGGGSTAANTLHRNGSGHVSGSAWTQNSTASSTTAGGAGAGAGASGLGGVGRLLGKRGVAWKGGSKLLEYRNGSGGAASDASSKSVGSDGSTLSIHNDGYFTGPERKRFEGSCVYARPKFTDPIHWRRGELLGSGAFGKVYLGLHTRTGELMAAKQIALAHTGAASDQCIRALENEIKVLRKLEHKNIVRYWGTERTQTKFTIFMEYIPGGSIASLLKKFGPFNETLVRVYAKQILEGLHYLHSHRIMHRDIKGANILVDRGGVCKLSDFGAARHLSDLNAAANGPQSLRGTPFWMAPEVIRQTGCGRQADIWSVGCTIIEMATGRPPFSHFETPVSALFHIAVSPEPPPFPEHLSDTAHDFLTLCFQKNPTDRPNAVNLLQHPFITSTFLSAPSMRNLNGSLGSSSDLALPLTGGVAGATNAAPVTQPGAAPSHFVPSNRSDHGSAAVGAGASAVGGAGAPSTIASSEYPSGGSGSTIPIPRGAVEHGDAGAQQHQHQRQQQQPHQQQQYLITSSVPDQGRGAMELTVNVASPSHIAHAGTTPRSGTRASPRPSFFGGHRNAVRNGRRSEVTIVTDSDDEFGPDAEFAAPMPDTPSLTPGALPGAHAAGTPRQPRDSLASEMATGAAAAPGGGHSSDGEGGIGLRRTLSVVSVRSGGSAATSPARSLSGRRQSPIVRSVFPHGGSNEARPSQTSLSNGRRRRTTQQHVSTNSYRLVFSGLTPASPRASLSQPSQPQQQQQQQQAAQHNGQQQHAQPQQVQPQVHAPPSAAAHGAGSVAATSVASAATTVATSVTASTTAAPSAAATGAAPEANASAGGGGFIWRRMTSTSTDGLRAAANNTSGAGGAAVSARSNGPSPATSPRSIASGAYSSAGGVSVGGSSGGGSGGGTGGASVSSVGPAGTRSHQQHRGGHHGRGAFPPQHSHLPPQSTTDDWHRRALSERQRGDSAAYESYRAYVEGGNAAASGGAAPQPGQVHGGAYMHYRGRTHRGSHDADGASVVSSQSAPAARFSVSSVDGHAGGRSHSLMNAPSPRQAGPAHTPVRLAHWNSSGGGSSNPYPGSDPHGHPGHLVVARGNSYSGPARSSVGGAGDGYISIDSSAGYISAGSMSDGGSWRAAATAQMLQQQQQQQQYQAQQQQRQQSQSQSQSQAPTPSSQQAYNPFASTNTGGGRPPRVSIPTTPQRKPSTSARSPHHLSPTRVDSHSSYNSYGGPATPSHASRGPRHSGAGSVHSPRGSVAGSSIVAAAADAYAEGFMHGQAAMAAGGNTADATSAAMASASMAGRRHGVAQTPHGSAASTGMRPHMYQQYNNHGAAAIHEHVPTQHASPIVTTSVAASRAPGPGRHGSITEKPAINGRARTGSDTGGARSDNTLPSPDSSSLSSATSSSRERTAAPRVAGRRISGSAALRSDSSSRGSQQLVPPGAVEFERHDEVSARPTSPLSMFGRQSQTTVA